MKLAVLLSAAALVAGAQEIKVAFKDPGRPKTVRVSLTNACLTATGYDGQEVIVEPSAGSRTHAQHGGLRRVELPPWTITSDDENNTVKISGHGGGRVRIRVPYAVDLKADCINGGELRVENTGGNLELNHHNGPVVALGVSGPVVAHSHNGRVTVSLDRVPAGKPMSISSWNGSVDLTLPPDARFTARMSTHNGSLYTDFELKIQAGSTIGGNNRSTTGAINGGGPELTLKTWNGNVNLRRRK